MGYLIQQGMAPKRPGPANGAHPKM